MTWVDYTVMIVWGWICIHGAVLAMILNRQRHPSRISGASGQYAQERSAQGNSQFDPPVIGAQQEKA